VFTNLKILLVLSVSPDEAQWLFDKIPELKVVRKRKLQNPSALPAVEVPHPGQSYNPTFKDHQALMSAAVQVQENRAKKQRKIDRVVEECGKAIATDKEELKELAELVFVKKEEDAKEEIEDDVDTKAALAIRPRMRTRQQRKNEREEKEKLRISKEKKMVSQRENEVFRIKTIKKKVEQEEKLQKAKLVQKAKKRTEHQKFGQHTLCKHKYKKLDPEIAFSDELSGTLRTGVKNGQSLLLDRFNSLQKRNILEPRIKAR